MMRGLLLAATCGVAAATTGGENWKDWLKDFGSDSYVYPDWVLAQLEACRCDAAAKKCTTTYRPQPNELSYCVAKEWLLRHLPAKDLHYLPPATSVRGRSMLDDTLAFSMMADRASPFTASISLDMKHAYLLPHSDLMESVQNWRGLFFSKFFEFAQNATSTTDAVAQLVMPNRFLEWNANYTLQWRTGTSPPVISPYDFIANGYGSCSAWSSLIVYTFRAVGIPARIVGSPCWNTGDFAGLATGNPNVTSCWNGGKASMAGPVGGQYLWNHNWVEVWDSEQKEWGFVNAPPGAKELNHGWMCTGYSKATGCAGGAASFASLDHPVFAYTWSLPGELAGAQGGEVVLGSELKLTSGEAVSPLVWSPHLQDAWGTPISHALRMVNRTEWYRNKQ